MTKKAIQESNFIFPKNRNGKFVAHRTPTPIIKCVCGFKILVIPDLKAMNRAIKNHIAEHKQVDYALVPDYLEEFLTEQILTATSKMSLPNLS